MHFENDTDLYRVIGANIKQYREQAELTKQHLQNRLKSASVISQKSKLSDAIKVFLYLC